MLMQWMMVLVMKMSVLWFDHLNSSCDYAFLPLLEQFSKTAVD